MITRPSVTATATGAEQARKHLPAILDAAEAGHTTRITRRGREVAAVVPATAAPRRTAGTLLALAGTGRGLWGADSTSALVKLRSEWNR